MNNEQTPQPNDLDSLIGDNHLQMMKAALPYMNVSQQRLISFFVKFNELRRTIDLFEDGEVAAMGICSVGEQDQSNSPIEMLNTIKPYGTPPEQDLIDLMINFIQGFRLSGSFSDTVPSSTVPGSAVPSSTVPSSTVPNSTVPNSTVPVQNQRERQNTPPPPHRQNNPFGRMPIEQLKNFMPPEQQSRLETMQLMMSALQQMN